MPITTLKATPRDADAELEDLDVREVSVVDRPANKRPFLIVKSAAGDLALTLEDDNMAGTAVAKEEGSLLDVLGLGLLDDTIAEPASEGEVIELTKALQPQVAKACAALLQKLSAIATRLKEEGKEASEGDAAEASTVAKALTMLADKLDGASGGDGDGGEGGEGDDKAEKADGGLKAGVLKATAMLMKVTAEVKAVAEDAEEMPKGLVAKLRAIATVLQSASGSDKDQESDDAEKRRKKPMKDEESEDDAEKGKKTEKAEALQVFVAHDKDDPANPEVIIKRGAKMKRARLNQFKRAVEVLGSLLKELEGEQSGGGADAGEKGGKEKGGKVSKSDAAVSELLAKGFEALEARVSEKLEEALKPVTEQLGTVAKRVDEIEGEATSNGDADASEVHKNESKKTTGFWNSVFRG